MYSIGLHPRRHGLNIFEALRSIKPKVGQVVEGRCWVLYGPGLNPTSHYFATKFFFPTRSHPSQLMSHEPGKPFKLPWGKPFKFPSSQASHDPNDAILKPCKIPTIFPIKPLNFPNLQLGSYTCRNYKLDPYTSRNYKIGSYTSKNYRLAPILLEIIDWPLYFSYLYLTPILFIFIFWPQHFPYFRLSPCISNSYNQENSF